MLHIQKDFFRTGKLTALLGFTSRSLVVITAFALILLTTIIVAVYFFLQYQKIQTQLDKAIHVGEQAALIGEVGKLIVLPTGEQPNIASVSDINRLKGQHFFANARNGDKVLIYAKAQEAILYDPFANKIVAVGPISLTNASTSSSGERSSLGSVRIAIYNGTSVVGLAATAAQELTKTLPDITIVAKKDAQKSTYTKTIVVDLTGEKATQAAFLAQKIRGEVGSLPAEEVKPANVDLLVILGK